MVYQKRAVGVHVGHADHRRRQRGAAVLQETVNAGDQVWVQGAGIRHGKRRVAHVQTVGRGVLCKFQWQPPKRSTEFSVQTARGYCVRLGATVLIREPYGEQQQKGVPVPVTPSR